jgi:hypothetical protein
MRRTLLIGLLWLLAPAVHATVIVPAEFREVVRGSDVIAYGRVESVRAEWADGRRRIETYVTFDVASYLKGNAGPTIVFRVPGGQLGRYRSVMLGAPVFQPGDEVFLFLKTGVSSTPVVFGFNQGVFRVRPDAGGRRLVASPALLAEGDAPQVLVRGTGERRAVPIESFAAQVQAVMADVREPGR